MSSPRDAKRARVEPVSGAVETPATPIEGSRVGTPPATPLPPPSLVVPSPVAPPTATKPPAPRTPLSPGKQKEYGIDLVPMERVNLNPMTQQSRSQVLITTPEFRDVADHIQQHGQDDVHVAEIQWSRFADGTPNLLVPAKDVRCRDVIMLADMSDTTRFFDVLSVIYSIPRYLARTFTVVVPFIPVATMERVDYEGQVSTAKVFADMLSNTPRALSGNTKIVVFDIHALQERFYFSDNVHVVFTSAVDLLIRQFMIMTRGQPGGPQGTIAVCFPDDGAKKRYGPVFEQQGYDTLVFSKIRTAESRFLKLTEGDPKGKHVVVVDDLCMTGGTLLGCKDELEKLGAVECSAFCTHGVFPNDAWKRFLPENTPAGKKPFSNFFITDSVPLTARKVAGHSPFRVLSIGRMISRLFNSNPVRDAFAGDLASERAGVQFYEEQRTRNHGVRTQEQWGPAKCHP